MKTIDTKMHKLDGGCPAQVENVSRRSFLKSVGVASGGLVLGGIMPSSMPVFASAASDNTQLNLFVSIAKDSTVSIICSRAEMGQGVRTSLPQIVADELEADWSKVKVVQGLANNDYGSQNTDGSSSVRDFYDTLRQMGASARVMLEQAAAKTWRVPASECQGIDHNVVHKPSGKSLSYGELADIAAGIDAPAVDALVLKKRSEHKYIGKGITSVDLPDVINGTTVFGQDFQYPGMLIASIERCPVIGGTIKSFDATAAKKVKGVVDVIEIKGKPLPALFNPLAGIAVIATNTWAALKGREKLIIDYDLGVNAKHESGQYLNENIKRVQTMEGTPHRQSGDVNAAFNEYSEQIEATYTMPYIAHAPMEPPAATAVLHDDGHLEVWACTQTPQRARDVVAGATGIAPEKIKMHMNLLGGAFGRKAKPDFVAEAALLAQATKKPIKVIWSREDDIKFDYVHAVSAQYFKGALNDKGQVKAWLARTCFPTIGSTFNPAANEPADFETSLGFADFPFRIDNIRCDGVKADAHLRIGWVRSVANIHHGFAVGSFVDELAAQAKQDPKDFWLALIGEGQIIDMKAAGFEKYQNYWSDVNKFPVNSARHISVIEAVCKNAGWGKKLPKGEGMGLSVHRSFLSYVAIVSHVKVVNNKLTIKKMYCAADCGIIANMDRVVAQMEGAMVFGMSMALMSQLTAKDGVIEQSNFHDYELVRMNQNPEMHVDILHSDEPPTGVGEPGVPPVMASITNAIFAATGKRIRDLPIKGQLDIA